ncbi:MAG: hypothetical protein J6S57_03395 [Alphaproteobacteria bacterium]|nr:hypothetical protein [Alphaproteobacteria bacterium]
MACTKHRCKCETSGRSMLEIIGVLVVMTMISAGAVVLVKSGMMTQKRNRTVDEVSAIVENIRGMYPDGFQNLTKDPEQGTQLIDALYLNTVTPFGSGTSYSVVGNGTKDYFFVTINGLDTDDCVVLSAQTWPNALNVECSDRGILNMMFGPYLKKNNVTQQVFDDNPLGGGVVKPIDGKE